MYTQSIHFYTIFKKSFEKNECVDILTGSGDQCSTIDTFVKSFRLAVVKKQEDGAEVPFSILKTFSILKNRNKNFLNVPKI